MISYGAAREADAEALARLHAACFSRGWTCDEIVGLLTARGSCAVLARHGDDGPAVGFVLARAVAGEAEILTIAVAPEHRRKGVARNLMQRLLADLGERGAATVFLEVGAGNAAALALYRGFGFAEVGRRRGYYAEPGGAAPGDALVLRAGLALPAMVSKSAETDYEKPV